jgi:hypothetical protein
VQLERNDRALLNALVIADDGDEEGGEWDREEELTREQLVRALPEAERKRPKRAVKNVLTYLRSDLCWAWRLSRAASGSSCPATAPSASTSGSPRSRRGAPLRAGQKDGRPRTNLALFEDHTEGDKLWRRTLERFKQAKALVLRVEAETAGLLPRMSDTRARLLQRSLLPWEEGPPVGQVRDVLEPIEFPWRLSIPRAQEAQARRRGS